MRARFFCCPSLFLGAALSCACGSAQPPPGAHAPIEEPSHASPQMLEELSGLGAASDYSPTLPCDTGLVLNKARNACSLGGVTPRRWDLDLDVAESPGSVWLGARATGSSLWTLEAVDSLRKEISDSGLLPDSFTPGWAPYRGSMEEVWSAFERDRRRASAWQQRLKTLITGDNPDQRATLEALRIQADLYYALTTKLYDTEPNDARDEGGALWGNRLRKELTALALIYVGSMSEALELAAALEEGERLASTSRRWRAVQQETPGLASILPPSATVARKLLKSYQDCEPWVAPTRGDYIPQRYQARQDDPQKTLTLTEATVGIHGSGRLVAHLETSLGNISCTLWPEVAPYTVANFVGLTRGLRSFKQRGTGEWAKRRAYDGTIFHRVIKGFMAQGGDPSGTGRGDPGYVIPNEQHPGLVFDRRGLLAAAHRGFDTNGMQFFITDAPAPHLNGGYTIYGNCEGVHTLDALMSVPTESGDRPVEPPVIRRVSVEAEFPCVP